MLLQALNRGNYAPALFMPSEFPRTPYTGSLQQFAVQLNHNTLSTLALAQEIFSEEKYALLTRLAQ